MGIEGTGAPGVATVGVLGTPLSALPTQHAADSGWRRERGRAEAAAERQRREHELRGNDAARARISGPLDPPGRPTRPARSTPSAPWSRTCGSCRPARRILLASAGENTASGMQLRGCRAPPGRYRTRRGGREGAP